MENNEELEIIDEKFSEEIGQLLGKICEAWEQEYGDKEAGEAEKTETDAIHHPDHYTWKGVECIKVIEVMTRGLTGIEAYYMGNIIKYLYRYPKKGTLVQDLRKAAQYVEFLKEHFEGMEEDSND